VPLSSLHHARYDGDSLFAILSLSALSSLSRTKIEALNRIGIRTVSDLIHFVPIQNAILLMAVARRDIGHDTSVEFLLDNSFLDRSPDEYPQLPVIAVEGVGPTYSAVLRDFFQVSTIFELSNFEPYLEAQSYLVSDDEVFNELASAPNALIPKAIGSITTTATFNDYVKSRRLPLSLHLSETAGNNLLADLFLAGHSTNMVRSHFGYIASYKQQWLNAGTHLGEILHSLALAPGESRNIAIVEWYRRQISERDEDTGIREQLSSSLVYARALSEVINATAIEHLTGLTEIDARTESLAKSRNFGVAGNHTRTKTIGLDLNSFGLPAEASSTNQTGLSANTGMSRVYSENEQRGTLKTETNGQRDLLSSTMQNITDTTSQLSEHFRSLWSTVVVSDAQSENEQLQTRNVTNYNHSHSLTIQYYEVLLKYITTIIVQRMTPLLWVPFQAIRFEGQIDFIRQNWPVYREALRNDPDQFKYFDNYFHETSRVSEIIKTGAFSVDTNDADSLGVTITDITIILEDPRAKITQTSGNKSFSNDRIWLGRSKVMLQVDGAPLQPELKVNINHRENRANLTLPSEGLDIDDIEFLQFVVVTNIVDGQPNPISVISKVSCRITLRMTLRDSNGKTSSVDLSELVEATLQGDEDTNIEERGKQITRSGERWFHAGTWAPFDEEGALAEAIREKIKSSFDTEIRNQQREIREQTASVIEGHFERYRYFYTRYLLERVEKLQIVEVIEGLQFENGTPMTNFIDPMPIAISDNLLGFRLLRPREIAFEPNIESDLENMIRGEISAFFDEIESEMPEPVTNPVFLPTSGVFAEAILGRSNASEFIDMRRYWNWQDSPIPHQAPEILPLQAGIDRRLKPEDLTPSDIESMLKLLQGERFPDTNTATMLQALQNGNMFRDAAKAEQLASVLGNLSSLAGKIAESAAGLSGKAAEDAMKAAVDIGKQVSDLAGTINTTTTEQSGKKAQAQTEAKSRTPDTKSTPTDPKTPENKEPKSGENGGGTGGSGSKPDPVAKNSVIHIPPNKVLFMNFETDKDVLTEGHKRELRNLIGELGLDFYSITEVEGHASTSGSEEHNQDLSNRRAISLWNEVHRIMSPLNSNPNFTPDFLKGSGEIGSFRKEFSHVKEIRDTVGEGHKNDPVEKAVLFTFKQGVEVEKIKPKSFNFFGLFISVMGHFVDIGDTFFVSTKEQNLKIVNKQTYDTTENNVTNKTVSEDNRKYDVSRVQNNAGDRSALNISINNTTNNAGDTFIDQGDTYDINIKLHIEFNEDGRAESVKEVHPEYDEWLLTFSGPAFQAERSFMDIIREITNLIIDLNPTSSPSGTLGQILNNISGVTDPDQQVDIVLDSLGIGSISRAILDKITFGQLIVITEFEPRDAVGARTTGKLSGPGIRIGTKNEAPDAIILSNAPYTTSKKVSVIGWDRQPKLVNFAYRTTGVAFTDVTAFLKALTLIVRMLPELGNPLADAFVDQLKQFNDLVSELPTASETYFKAFKNDIPPHSMKQHTLPIGTEIQFIAMAPGQFVYDKVSEE
jgi:outer membrane protein OmpA-like peptidoglycan-associated protein